MITNKSTFFCLFIISLSCTMNDNTRSYQLAKTNQPKTTDKEQPNRNKSIELIWETPDSWISSEGSSMRLASFAIPYSGGIGDLSVIKHSCASTSSSTRGVIFSGRDSPSDTLLDVIEYVTNASTGEAADFGDLSSARYSVAGGSDTHGGL